MGMSAEHDNVVSSICDQKGRPQRTPTKFPNCLNFVNVPKRKV